MRQAMAPSFTLNPSDGSARVAGFPLVLRKGLFRGEVASALSPLFRTANDFGNGYEWLSFHNVTFGGHPCGFALCFQRGQLTEVHFSVILPNAEMQDGWPTRQAIEAELAFVRKELHSQLGTEVGEHATRFPWGTVWSMFDPKAFQARSGLRYDA
jgi:hypothetical protein